MEEVCRGKDEVVTVKEQEIAAKQRALSEAERQVGSLAEECAALKGKLEGNTEQMLSLQVDIQTLQVLQYCTQYYLTTNTVTVICRPIRWKKTRRLLQRNK